MQVVPKWYWIAAAAALLWAGAGCVAYVSQVSMSDGDMARLPQAQREIWSMTPVWVTAAYAVAVWSALAGAVALLLRHRTARLLYLVSLLAVIVQFGWTLLVSPILTTVGPSAIAFPAFIIAAAGLTLWFAHSATRRGWLR